MERFEIADDEWEEILEVLRTEASQRGISTDDFPAMLTLIKQHWNLISNKGLRQRQIVHAKHRDLASLRDKQLDSVKAIDDELKKLPPDRGPLT